MAFVVSAAASAMPRWRNSTDGIHAFLTFDGLVDASNITAFASRIDYVWGASGTNVAAWRSPNPEVVLSYYMPFTRDPHPHIDASKSGLPWWIAHKPALVLYQCDRKNPAWECFAGEGCSHVSVPLDLTNPATLDYQMSAGVEPAAKLGYNAIALDNYNLKNSWSACGAFKGEGGAWVQIYDDADPKADARYTADVLDWTARAVARIHDVGMLVIPNFSEESFDKDVLAVTNLTDGVLSEAGFATWNPVPNTTSRYTPPLKTSPERFAAQVQFVRNLQRAGKGYFAINEWGEGPDYGLNPAKVPYNISERFGEENRAIRQFVTAAFMMVNGGSCGIFLTCIQCYGGGAGGLGEMSLWPEYSANVGYPLGEPIEDFQDSHVWARFYSRGVALVNPRNASSSFPLAAGGYVDLYRHAPVGSVVQLAPSSGLVLLKAA